MKKIRPFLKWAGNKYQSLSLFLHFLPQADRLIEPFAGSGAVFLNTSYPQYVLAENNQDLISLFHSIQNEGSDFIEYCASFFSSENNTSHRYYELREKFNQSTNQREKAALFLYLNRHGYNGLCRYNNSGQYNVPFGRYNSPYFPALELSAFYEKSRQAEFHLSDFRTTMLKSQQGDLIYCDPPYVSLKEKQSRLYRNHFSEDSQYKLAELAMQCANRGIPVIISNHDTEFTRKIYRDAEIKSFFVKRTISCQIDNRNPARELLAIFR